MHAALSFRLLPNVAQLPRIVRDPLHVFRVCAAEAPIARLPMSAHPLRPCYQVSSPSLVQHVLSSGASRYAKGRSLEPLHDLAGRGLLTSDGAHWERHRRLITPSLTQAHYERFTRGVAYEAERYLDTLLDGKDDESTTDVCAAMMDLTLRVIVRALLDDDFPFLDSLRTVVQRLWDLVARQAVVSSVLPWVPPLSWRRSFRTTRSALDDLLGAMIAQARRDPNGQGLLARWIAADDPKGGGPLRDEELREEVATFLLAGHETVGASITWALIQLALAPAVQESVAREAAALPAAERLTASDVEGLALARAVFLETTRLYPQPPILFRRAIVDDDVGGLSVARGAEIVVPTHVMHRDPAFWPAPDSFRPERFLEGAPSPPPEAFLPFGLGPRRCLGMRHAMIEGPLVLALLARRFRVLPAAKKARYARYLLRSSLRPQTARLVLARRAA